MGWIVICDVDEEKPSFLAVSEGLVFFTEDPGEAVRYERHKDAWEVSKGWLRCRPRLYPEV